jgi:hypothetical protein
MRKWSAVPAVAASSLVFALLHTNKLGTFMSGAAVAVLYLRTRALLVPIALHAANNAIAFGLDLLDNDATGIAQRVLEGPSTIEALRSSYASRLVFLGLSVPVLAYFFYANRSVLAKTRAPYKRNADLMQRGEHVDR